MEEKNKPNSSSESENYLRQIMDTVVDIHDTLKKMQVTKEDDYKPYKAQMYQHQKMQDVVLSKDVLLEQLKISQSTLAKWKYRHCIKYKNQGSRLGVYSYMDVMDALAEDRLTARGFNPLAAYKRLLVWYNKNIENTNQ